MGVGLLSYILAGTVVNEHIKRLIFMRRKYLGIYKETHKYVVMSEGFIASVTCNFILCLS